MNLAQLYPGLIITGDRQPLPAGHPVSWGAITTGTVLADADYPRDGASKYPRK